MAISHPYTPSQPLSRSRCLNDGTNQRDNITNWALGHFRERYGDEKITKWDIFYYVYAVLHHPEYRAKYAENLKRELPRIPLAVEKQILRSAQNDKPSPAVILRSPDPIGTTKNLGSAGTEQGSFVRQPTDSG